MEQVLHTRAISEKSKVKIEYNKGQICSFATAWNSLINKQTRTHEYGGKFFITYYVKHLFHEKWKKKTVNPATFGVVLDCLISR